MHKKGLSDHQKDVELATALADAYRQADNEDRLIYPAEVLILLDAFQELWPHYGTILWPSLYDQIAISLQPGVNTSHEDPREAAKAMALLMEKLNAEFEVRAHDPAELLRYARRVRAFLSNVSGCARAVARVLQTLIHVREVPSKPLPRLLHHFRIIRPLKRYDGLLNNFAGRFKPSLVAIRNGERPIVSR